MGKKNKSENMAISKEQVKDNLKKTKKTKLFFSILKFAVLIGIVVCVPLYIYFCQRHLLEEFRSFDDIIAFLKTYKTESIFVYIGVQVLQIIISVIPGQAFQFAAGYLFGFIMGLLYSLIGAVIGTTLSFYLAKFLGKDAMHILFGDERMKYFIERLNSKRAYDIVFLIYLVPGLPKDIMSYAAGISEMKFKTFLIVSLIGRTPGMAGSLLIGSLYMKQHYIGMAVVSVIAVLAFILCIVFRKKINEFIDRLYEKIK